MVGLLKRKGEKTTPAQDQWIASVRAAGGIAVVASSVEELERTLKAEGWRPN